MAQPQRFRIKGISKWFGPPMGGTVESVDNAYIYDLEIEEERELVKQYVKFLLATGHKITLRQVLDALERDIWATPAPEYVECPDCEGLGTDCVDDPYPCGRCNGEGRLKLQDPTCIHGNRGPCLTCGSN